jgi:hypothetical protein
MGGSSAKQKTKSTQTTTLPANQQANVDLLMQGTQDLYNSGGPQYMPGANYTTATPEQLQARNMAMDYATGAGQDMVNSAQSANNFWMDPNRVFDLQSVPGYGASRQGIIDSVTRMLTENYLPNSRSGAIAGGTLGGSRQGMMDALAAGRTGEALTAGLGNLDLGIYSQNLAANQNAISRAPAMYQLGTAPADTVNAVGGAYRADTAEQIAGDKERWDFQQMQLPRLLAMVQALTGTAGQYGGTVTGKQTTKGSGGGSWMQPLGAAMSLGSMLMGQNGMFGGSTMSSMGGAGGAPNYTGRLPVGGQMVG